MSTRAAQTSIHALSPADCAAVTLWSSWLSLSMTAWGTSGVAALAAGEEGISCAWVGRELRTNVNKQQHQMTMGFINKVLRERKVAPNRCGIQVRIFRGCSTNRPNYTQGTS